ncbi:hypothetical protein Taro_026340 [Colocasia esculenta]|uniref:Protein kinase domain-containing protein n=1 Tax=Colocasia esculenta TaxID=4460 RepID=A0A843VR18_COLES|nr:hypothetical protein [Colocasia esculenta]
MDIMLGLLLFISALTALESAYTPADNYLIDCGASADTTIGSRTFAADKPAAPWSISSPQNSMLASTNSSALTSFDSALYRTARIFTGAASYSVPIRSPGRHWIRLYFFPFVFQGVDLTRANFSVTAQEFVLIGDSRGLNLSTPSFKEYSVNITSGSLTLSFLPSGNSTAFVNAIEVVSAPDGLFSTAQPVDPSVPPQSIPELALQTMHRINMGGPAVLATNDTLTRTWHPDEGFLVNKNLVQVVVVRPSQIQYVRGGPTQETAPASVYSTAAAMASANVNGRANFNVTWDFPVDAGFLYLIRFHFCDIVSTQPHQLVFNVYINSQVAAPDLDLNTLTFGTMAAPYVMDFVAAGVGATGSAKLRVSIGASSHALVPNATLNGLEILKLSNSQGSLGGQVSASDHIMHAGSKRKAGALLAYVLGALGAVAASACLLVLLGRWRLAKKRRARTQDPFFAKGGSSGNTGGSSGGATVGTASSGQKTNLIGFRFAFAVVQEATHNFDENRVIGFGGFGKVYRGALRDGTQVAVKRANPRSRQGLHEFLTEIELLSQLRHRHLVSLIGFCDERGEMILVYEYMKNGTLRSHLYGSDDLPNLSWKQRLEICIGAATALHYLHAGQAKAIIHRDVKSANILLDENLTAKVADFGISKTVADLDQSHVSTAVKGSFGYLDPEYFRRHQLTEKSDVYSFGVVLLEVLCARPVIDHTLPEEMVGLTEWALECQKRGQLWQVVDPRIAGSIRSDSLRKFGETAEKCLADYGVDRPSMSDVLWNLQYVLQLQEELVPAFLDVDSVNRIPELGSRFHSVRSTVGGAPVEESGSVAGAGGLSDVSLGRVFSSGTDLSGVAIVRMHSSTDVSDLSKTSVFLSGGDASGVSVGSVFSQLGRSQGSVGPSSSRSLIPSATLNGMEITKLSNSEGSVGGQVSVRDATPPSS